MHVVGVYATYADVAVPRVKHVNIAASDQKGDKEALQHPDKNVSALSC